jgi:hypothetical protein
MSSWRSTSPTRASQRGVADAYAQHSEAAGVPAILATLRTADELADALT